MLEISIIVPVYKVEAYLAECIESILNQSFTDFELILIDDGSPDRCPKICDDYAKKDRRIRVIHQNNTGLSGARNMGIDVCKGRFITFIDSDDIVHSEYLKTLYELTRNNNCDIAVIRNKSFIDSNELNLKMPSIGTEHIYTSLKACESLYLLNNKHSIPVMAWGKLYEKRLFAVTRFPIGKLHEDQFTTYKAFYAANKVVVSDKELYFNRRNVESITRSKFNLKRYDDIQGISEAIEFYEQHKQFQIAEAAKIHKEFLIIYYALEARKSHVYQLVPKEFKRTLIYSKSYLNKMYGKDYSQFFLYRYYPRTIKCSGIVQQAIMRIKQFFKMNEIK